MDEDGVQRELPALHAALATCVRARALDPALPLLREVLQMRGAGGASRDRAYTTVCANLVRALAACVVHPSGSGRTDAHSQTTKRSEAWCAALNRPHHCFQAVALTSASPSPALCQVRACGDVGDTGTAFAMVSALDQAGVKVAAPVYAALLSACARAGKPARASAVLEDMWAEGVQLTEACYAALREVRSATGWTAEEVAAMVRAAGFDSNTTTEARRRLMHMDSDATYAFGKSQSHRKLCAVAA
jgi:pentatricopeptide repeat protein